MHRASSTDVSPSLEALSCPQRPRAPSDSTSSHHDPHHHQRAHIRRVLQARHAFEVLELPLQTTSPVTVRRAFRKFALQLHPDKNAAPDAQKAFIRLSEAHEVLRDVEEQKHLLGKLRPPKREGFEGSKEDALNDSTTPWKSFSFVRPTCTSTSGSNNSSTDSGSTAPQSKGTSFSSSRSFIDFLREWEDFEREYMDELRGKQTSLEAQARKEKRQSRRRDVEECQAAERRILLAHLMESVRDDEDEEEGEDKKIGKGGVKEEGGVEEEQTQKRKENTWQAFLNGKKRTRTGNGVKQGGGQKCKRGGGEGGAKEGKRSV